jgi:hypothetical protein
MNMQRVKTLLWCALLSVSFSLARPLTAKAAEADRSMEKELRRKTEEVERLKQELQQAQDQLKQLKADNERLQKEQARPPRLAPTAPPKPLTPLATLPQLKAGQLVDLDELAGHFRADPAAAGVRYGKQTFRVKGAVARFDPAIMLRNYDVILASPDSLLAVACNFRYPDHFTAVYTKQKGQVLVARAGSKAEHKLLHVGETVIIQGKCRGLKDGQIVLTGCEMVK